jgi:hypothetical protein
MTGAVVGHHDHPCPCACSTSSSSGSAAGWSGSAGHRPPRTPNCSCCGMRSPSCAAPIPGPAGLGLPRSSRRAHPAPAGTAAGAPTDHPWHRPALAPPPDHPQVDLPEPYGSAAGQHRDRRADRGDRRLRAGQNGHRHPDPDRHEPGAQGDHSQQPALGHRDHPGTAPLTGLASHSFRPCCRR